jgi:hypothetical protein
MRFASGRSRTMIQHTPRPLPTCPDCGGILHAMRSERLTSSEVADAEAGEAPAMLICQCLLCGYTEARPVDHPSDEAPALA